MYLQGLGQNYSGFADQISPGPVFSLSLLSILEVRKFQPTLSAPQLPLVPGIKSAALLQRPKLFPQSFDTIITNPFNCAFLPATCHSEF